MHLNNVVELSNIVCHLGLAFKAVQLFQAYTPLHTDVYPGDFPVYFLVLD